jgi:hypothetical protein
MLEIVPVLPVEKSCQWCAPQKCFTASVWWGDVLLSFYTPHAYRLQPEALNDAACNVLREVTKAIQPGAETIISSEELHEAVGSPFILGCHWEDFTPA